MHACIVEMLLAELPAMTRFPRPTKNHPRAGNGAAQTIVVVIAIAAVLALGALATNQYLVAAKRQAAGTFEASNDDDIYTGSILYLPYEGSNCRQLLFDNRSGRFTDNGNVDCAQASSESGIGSPKQWSAARAKAISMGFRDH